MKFVTAYKDQLQIGDSPPRREAGGFVTGLPELDALPPGGRFDRGAVHELLHAPEHPTPDFPALVLARSALADLVADRPRSSAASLVWFDPDHTLHPPALARQGIALDRLIIVRPQCQADLLWSLLECLRYRGVAAAVATIATLTRIQARKLRLAAEQGGSIALLLRPKNRQAQAHAAATRWLVAPAPGDRLVQRWTLQLIHGHGGRLDKAIYLEHHRETNHLRSAPQLAHRSSPAAQRA